MKKEIEFDRVASDSNGNPRYACHFHALITEQDREHAKKLYNTKTGLTGYEIEWLYDKALSRARKLGGKKFHNKQFGGGIVFQSHNIKETAKKIQEFVNNVQYVQFLIEKDTAVLINGGKMKVQPSNDIFAYFPYENHNREGTLKACYAHIGQHSSCSPEYAKECKPAKPKQYNPLKNELEDIGYNLEIIK